MGMLWKCLLALACTGHLTAAPAGPLQVRGIYGGVPVELFEGGRTLAQSGVNAVWISSGSINDERVRLVRSQGARLYAEFNTMHYEAYVKEHPDAAPVGKDGAPSSPPHGWQGVCPTHPGYRRNRMDAFRALLAKYEVDGVWLDYHHSHSAWERADPVMPDTCFCTRCIEQFQRESGVRLPRRPSPDVAPLIMTRHRKRWLKWRLHVYTDWVREFREILDAMRPGALLGTFHNPWSDSDFNGARLEKLAIDLRAQARYVDVFSPMPYHARFGYARDPQWIERQVRWLGRYLNIRGTRGERLRIWPIVQLSDWGETVPAEQVEQVLDYGSRPPATGVLVFAWGSLRKQPDKVERLVRFYRR